jgi:L-alanine-DL-glutamate epimerase-like enolase superfamily enzyme
MRITQVLVECRTAPSLAGRRISLTGATPPPARDEVIVTIQTDEGIAGQGAIPVAPCAVSLIQLTIQELLSSRLIEQDPTRTDALLAETKAAVEPIGWPGIVARAYAAIDFALWDLKSKAAGKPIGVLLGDARQTAPFFVSDTGGPASSPDDIASQSAPWIKRGAKGVRIELGSGDVQQDADRARAVSESLGDDVWLGVSAEGRYDLATALALAHFFDDLGIGWFEQPLPLSDRSGYDRIANRMETILAAGSTSDSLDELISIAKQGAVRVLRPDPLRLGGITPLVKLAAVAEACHATMVPVRCPAIGEQLVLGLTAVPQFERDTLSP